MTLKTRNVILYGLFIITSIAVIIYIVLLFITDFSHIRIITESQAAHIRYLGMAWPVHNDIVAMNVLAAGLSVCMAWAGAFVFYRVFRLISSPQLFFIVLFWICLGAGLIRMVNISMITAGEGIGVRIALSRGDIAFKILGLLSIFAASMHTIGIPGQKQGSMFLIIVVVSFALSSYFPLNISSPKQCLLFGASGVVNDDAFCLIIGLLTVMNYLRNAVNTMDLSDWTILIHIVLMILGQQLHASAGNWWVLVIAWIMILTGSIGIARRYMSNYLWY